MRAIVVGFFALFCSSCARPAQTKTEASPSPEAASSGVTNEAADPVAAEPKSLELDLATVVWAPFTGSEGQENIATGLVEAALQRSGITMRSHVTEPEDVLRSLQDGTFDGSPSLWKSPEREAYLLFSKPYLENRLVLVGRKGDDVSVTQIGDLAGKKVGLVEGYAYGSAVDSAKGVEFVRGKSDEDNLRALLEKKLDYILLDDLLVYHMFEYAPERAARLLSAGDHPLVLRGLHFALRKDLPGAVGIVEKFNEQISKMILSGDYHRILNVNWLVADTDGDGEVEYVSSSASVGGQLPSNRYHLFGPEVQAAPRFVIEGEVYDNWDSVPQHHKELERPIPDFRPAVNLVLFDF